MITKPEKLKALLRRKTKSNKTYLYSQIIKNERLKRHMTLEEMAKGICSVSYLCKVEKNAIEPDESYIKAIFEKVNLDYDKVGKNILEDGIRKLLQYYLNRNYEGIKVLYEEIEDSIFNANNYLIKGLYFLNKKDYREFRKVIRTLDKIKDTLLRDDVGVMLFLVVEYYIETYQFNEAYDHLRYLHDNFEYPELNWLIHEQHFRVGLHLGRYPMAMKHYLKLMKNINIGYPTKKQTIMKLMLLSLKAEEYYEEVEKEIMNFQEETDDYDYYQEVFYWKLVILIKGRNYLEVFDKIIKEDLFQDVRFIGLLVYAADNINDENYWRQAVDIAEKHSYQETDAFLYKLIRFFVLKMTSDKKHLVIEYLKYNLLPVRNTYYHHLLSRAYEDYYVNYLCKSSKYKEAVKFLSKQRSG
ncbi:MAG: helix-turn-helix domain-containing protein [Bacilli bacterium]